MKKDLFEEKGIQTVSKHNIFENYLEPWAKIISNQAWVKNAYYVDAFAGAGKYQTGEEGSPVIAARILKKYQKSTCKLHCICIERDAKRYRDLQDSVKEFEPELNVEKYNKEFLNCIDKILTRIGRSPAFFFIDPEGFSGMDFHKIEAILSLPHREVLINFQYNAIQRWLEAPKVEGTIAKLFGTPDYKKARKESDLIKLYKAQVRKTGAFVWYFRNRFPRKNRTFYYLVYATKNLTGFKIMKDVMFSEQSKRFFEPDLFEDVAFQDFQSDLLKRYEGKKGIEYNEVLGFVLQESNYLARDLQKALKNIGVKKTKSATQKNNPSLNFPKGKPGGSVLCSSVPRAGTRIKIHYGEYEQLDGRKEALVARVNDGSIITRFDKTPLPETEKSVVCPHFLELKWAYGCPYDCAWCYLKGTFRFQPKKTAPVVKPYEKIERHTRRFLEEVKTPEILNAGEIADSLMHENAKLPFSKFIIPMFEEQELHKVLLLTKSSSVENLLEIESHKQVIMSFSLNAIPVAERWEKAPGVMKRVEAAKKVLDAGYEIRIRIDPMVPIENWERHYLELLEIVFDKFTPDRITLGSLRGLQTTINGCSDRSWVKYLKESSNWGKKIDFETREALYSTMIDRLNSKYDFSDVTVCKETVEMWSRLGLDYKKIKCNCVW